MTKALDIDKSRNSTPTRCPTGQSRPPKEPTTPLPNIIVAISTESKGVYAAQKMEENPMFEEYLYKQISGYVEVVPRIILAKDTELS